MLSCSEGWIWKREGSEEEAIKIGFVDDITDDDDDALF